MYLFYHEIIEMHHEDPSILELMKIALFSNSSKVKSTIWYPAILRLFEVSRSLNLKTLKIPQSKNSWKSLNLRTHEDPSI